MKVEEFPNYIRMPLHRRPYQRDGDDVLDAFDRDAVRDAAEPRRPSSREHVALSNVEFHRLGTDRS